MISHVCYSADITMWNLMQTHILVSEIKWISIVSEMSHLLKDLAECKVHC